MNESRMFWRALKVLMTRKVPNLKSVPKEFIDEETFPLELFQLVSANVYQDNITTGILI